MVSLIMVDREDFEGMGFQESLFYRKWIPGEPEAVACDYADVPAPGPFLIRANDEAVWFSHGQGDWMKIASNPHYDGPEQRRWSHLTTLYAKADGLSLRMLVSRIKSIKQRLRRTPDRWFAWWAVYPWRDGADLIWSGLEFHPRLEIRVNGDRKEVRYVSR